MADRQGFIFFTEGWSDTGQIGDDGFPIFIDTTMITVEIPPLTKLPPRAATKQDMAEYPEEYAAFLAVQKAKRNTGTEGYPLVYWPAVTVAEVEMLAKRGVFTVDALAKLAGGRDMPAQLAELALRAERMLDMQKDFGKYEAILAEREGEIAVLEEQLKEMRASLSAANAIIETLKLKAA